MFLSLCYVVLGAVAHAELNNVRNQSAVHSRSPSRTLIPREIELLAGTACDASRTSRELAVCL